MSGELKDQGRFIHKNPLYLLGYIFPLFLFIGIVVLRKQQDRLETDVGYARKRQASRKARTLFTSANKALKSSQREDFYSAVTHALTKFIADHWNLPPSSVTADTVESILVEKEVAYETVKQVKSCLNTCNFARFAPSSDSVTDEMKKVLKEAQDCVANLEKHRK